MGTLGWTDFQGSSRGSGVKGVRGRGIPRIVNGYMRVGGFQGSAYVRIWLPYCIYVRTYVTFIYVRTYVRTYVRFCGGVLLGGSRGGLGGVLGPPIQTPSETAVRILVHCENLWGRGPQIGQKRTSTTRKIRTYVGLK